MKGNIYCKYSRNSGYFLSIFHLIRKYIGTLVKTKLILIISVYFFSFFINSLQQKYINT